MKILHRSKYKNIKGGSRLLKEEGIATLLDFIMCCPIQNWTKNSLEI